MNSIAQPPIDYLFSTNAVKVASPDKPFLFTSGLIGLYYINADYLCGGKDQALEVLQKIDATLKSNPKQIASNILPLLQRVYNNSEIYRHIIDTLVNLAINQNPKFISGGERRDWIFAPLVAVRSSIQCIYIMKDKKIIDTNGTELHKLSGSILHIADLLNVGASYTNIWIPSMDKVDSKINMAVNIVDRQQGGTANLHAAGIEVVQSIYKIDTSLFEEALLKDLLNEKQSNLAKEYLLDPDGTMRNFLLNNPDFLKDSLLSNDPKIAARARKLITDNLYNLPKEFIAYFEA
jgi:orotate phosphoribosyltransferase